jgi:SAM-dependent methyltransferase
MSNEPIDHWQRHAQQWSQVGAPLRPSPEDIAGMRTALTGWSGERGPSTPVVLVLGMTPELCRLGRELGGRVMAVDNSADMIRALWPRDARDCDRAICADWRQVPLPAGSIDVVLADGSLSALPFPGGYAALLAELRRLLRPGGRCLIRCFVSPDRKETVEGVFAALLQGEIGNFHVLKWRLAMALQPEAAAGVAVGRVWQALHREWADPARLAERFHWPLEQVRTIDAYRGVDTRYTFPTLTQYRRAFELGGFQVMQITTPGYELGERCLSFVLAPLEGAVGRA